MNLFPSISLPRIQTRKALLLLDFQNDFVRPSGALAVSNTTDFLDNLPELAKAFRHVGDVVWVRSHYEERRLLWDPDSHADRIVLTSRLEDDGKKNGHGDNHDSTNDEEAFLTIQPPRCCLPKTSGHQFPAPILAAIDTDGGDTVLEKSDYSAFQSEGLVLTFRTRFVTQLYLCGSLSNVSVYATALDAARHGFSVTLIEDCLGFRSFGRHEEAMRRMADILGASGITADELYEELDWQETDAIASRHTPEPTRSITAAGIEGVLDELDVKASPSPRQTKFAALEEQPELSVPEDRQPGKFNIDVETMSDEDSSLPRLLELFHARYGSYYNGPRKYIESSIEGRGVHRLRQSSRPESRAESASRMNRRSRRRTPETYLGPGTAIGERDSRIIHDLDLPPDAFEKIRGEVTWQKMYHLSGQVPRLVAVQGQCKPDASIPIYRHPVDEAPPLLPFTPTVDRIRVIVERILRHPLNHVLIQLYRDGQDHITEHSDKTLDIVRDSFICNVSLGAQRVMVLRTKTSARELSPDEKGSGRQIQRVLLPHESLFILGQKTNMRWLHGIRPDKRPDSAKSAEERAYGGARISLTFRHIGTFTDPVAGTIWGQGAVAKSREEAGKVIHGDSTEAERLIRAFGQENRATEFDWDAVYGGGFNVINFVTATSAMLVPSGDPVADMRVRLCLEEAGQRHKVTESDSSESSVVGQPQYFDPEGTEVIGDINILTHIAEHPPTRAGVELLPGGSQLSQIEELLRSWRDYRDAGRQGKFGALDHWEQALALDSRHYLNGTAFGVDDCSLWPVLREIEQKTGMISTSQYPSLHRYYNRIGNRGCVKAVLEEMGQS